MVKFGKNKFKALNKIAKKQTTATNSATPNKIIKRKENAEKKVFFQKEVLKEAVTGRNPLVKNVSREEMLLNELAKKIQVKKPKTQEVVPSNKPKPKPVKKQKQRQKMQISDTKLLLNLMKLK